MNNLKENLLKKEENLSKKGIELRGRIKKRKKSYKDKKKILINSRVECQNIEYLINNKDCSRLQIDILKERKEQVERLIHWAINSKAVERREISKLELKHNEVIDKIYAIHSLCEKAIELERGCNNKYQEDNIAYDGDNGVMVNMELNKPNVRYSDMIDALQGLIRYLEEERDKYGK